MKRKLRTILTGLLRSAAPGAGLFALALTLAPGAVFGAAGKLSGPFTHRNLQIFLIHGDTQLESRHYATLGEALARRMVVIKETGNVSELAIENLSSDATVFLHAGDIVKGGRQDRTIRDDLILQTRSGWTPLPSFCVEQGRWTKRGSEDAANFAENNKLLTSRKLKMASRYENNQADVWSGVAEQQSLLNNNLSRLYNKNVDVRDSASTSSLQLALEGKDLEKIRKEYLNDLERLVNGKTDVMGFAYAINGEINSAEVYNNKNLFRALWPKLIDAAITEAVSEYDSDRHSQVIGAADVRAFFATAVAGSSSERSVSKSTTVRTLTTPSTVLFETLDTQTGDVWIHKSFINKGKEVVTVPFDGESLHHQRR
jgi:hypothetical protein